MRPLILAVLIAVTLALPMPADAQCPPMTSTNVFIQFSNPSGTCTQAGGTCGVGETLTFTAQRYQYDFGCAAHTFSWNFGDGSATATGQGPVNHTYTSANTYTVQLTIANPSQTFVVSQAVRVGSCGTMRPGQNVFISYHDQNFNCTYLSGNCPAPATIYFAASSFGDYNFNCGTHTFNWMFGDGQMATGQTPTHTYVASGTYDIICNVSGPTGSVNLTAVVVVGPPDVVPTAAFTWLPASPIAGQPVTFSDASTGNPTSWLWEFGDGTSSNATNPIHTFSSAGTYNVELSVANRVGARHVAHLIAVLAAPVASFNWSPTRPAVRDAVQFVDSQVARRRPGCGRLAMEASRIPNILFTPSHQRAPTASASPHRMQSDRMRPLTRLSLIRRTERLRQNLTGRLPHQWLETMCASSTGHRAIPLPGPGILAMARGARNAAHSTFTVRLAITQSYCLRRMSWAPTHVVIPWWLQTRRQPRDNARS